MKTLDNTLTEAQAQAIMDAYEASIATRCVYGYGAGRFWLGQANTSFAEYILRCALSQAQDVITNHLDDEMTQNYVREDVRGMLDHAIGGGVRSAKAALTRWAIGQVAVGHKPTLQDYLEFAARALPGVHIYDDYSEFRQAVNETADYAARQVARFQARWDAREE